VPLPIFTLLSKPFVKLCLIVRRERNGRSLGEGSEEKGRIIPHLV